MYVLESMTFGHLVFSLHFSCNNPKLSSPRSPQKMWIPQANKSKDRGLRKTK